MRRRIPVEIVGLSDLVQRDVPALSADRRLNDNSNVLPTIYVQFQLSMRQLEQGKLAWFLLAVGAAACGAGLHQVLTFRPHACIKRQGAAL